MAVRESPGLKQLVGAAGNQVIDLLGALEGRIANESLRCLWCLNKFRCSLIFHTAFLLSRELSSENCGVLVLCEEALCGHELFQLGLSSPQHFYVVQQEHQRSEEHTSELQSRLHI